MAVLFYTHRTSLDGQPEDAITFCNSVNIDILRLIETPDGVRVRVGPLATEHDPGIAEFDLNAEQARALGRFCVQLFCGEPREHLVLIKEAAARAIGKLEDWNERARADEEHPPYDDICATLRNINHAIDELEKALR